MHSPLLLSTILLKESKTILDSATRECAYACSTFRKCQAATINHTKEVQAYKDDCKGNEYKIAEHYNEDHAIKMQKLEGVYNIERKIATVSKNIAEMVNNIRKADIAFKKAHNNFTDARSSNPDFLVLAKQFRIKERAVKLYRYKSEKDNRLLEQCIIALDGMMRYTNTNDKLFILIQKYKTTLNIFKETKPSSIRFHKNEYNYETVLNLLKVALENHSLIQEYETAMNSLWESRNKNPLENAYKDALDAYENAKEQFSRDNPTLKEAYITSKNDRDEQYVTAINFAEMHPVGGLHDWAFNYLEDSIKVYATLRKLALL
jgi:tetratricopeptide (TPR) repeat protein